MIFCNNWNTQWENAILGDWHRACLWRIGEWNNDEVKLTPNFLAFLVSVSGRANVGFQFEDHRGSNQNRRDNKLLLIQILRCSFILLPLFSTNLLILLSRASLTSPGLNASSKHAPPLRNVFDLEKYYYKHYFIESSQKLPDVVVWSFPLSYTESEVKMD